MTTAELAPPAPDLTAPAAPVHSVIARATAGEVADRATRRTCRLPAVRTAVVEVLGDPAAPVLRAQIAVDPAADFSATVTEVMDTVVPAMERDLGTAFVTHEVDFSLAETSRSRTGAPAPLLTIA